MDKAAINRPFSTIKVILPTTNYSPNIIIDDAIPDLAGSIYMENYLSIFQFALTPSKTNSYIQDIYNSRAERDLEIASREIIENVNRESSHRNIFVSDKPLVLIKSYTIQNGYANEKFLDDKSPRTSMVKLKENPFYIFNINLITNKLLEFIIEFTKPNNTYEVLIARIPTIIGRGTIDFIYLLTTLFNNVEVIKYEESMWIKDSFIVIAKGPIHNNFKAIKNKLGSILRQEDIKSQRQLTLKTDHLDGRRLTSLFGSPNESPYSRGYNTKSSRGNSFLEEWKKFSRAVCLEIFRFHKILTLSIASNTLINPYQDFLKSGDVIAGDYKCNHMLEIIEFSAYLKINHVNHYIQEYQKDHMMKYEEYLTNYKEESTTPILMYNQITREIPYQKEDVYPNNISFGKRGQIKLFLAEVRYLTKILPHLRTNKKKLIIYIGAAPGVHILNVIKMFHNDTITWALYDSVKYCSELEDIDNLSKYNIELYHKYFTEVEIELYKNNSLYKDYDIHLISDIRTVSSGEPSTEDLIRDYNLENNIVTSLSPKTCFLKWRYPYITPRDKVNNLYRVNRVIGNITEEWVQSFTYPESSEMRMYIEGPNYTLKSISTEECLTADKRLQWYKMIGRYTEKNSNQLQYKLSNCLCNDCCIMNYTVDDCNKNGIELTIQHMNF